MKLLRKIQDIQEPFFMKGGPLERLYPIYEANDTFLFTPGHVTKHGSHVRDGIDLKRMMITVVVALLPCMLWAMYNTGLQAHKALNSLAPAWEGWQTQIYIGLLGLPTPTEGLLGVLLCTLHGALYYLPIYIVTLAVGGLLETAFSIIRKHEINEGFLVTSALLPLTLPPTIPLWMVALGIAFGVVIGKEIFGGTGMNIWNPALTARAFLFFAYPAHMSGDKIWIAAETSADGYSGATLLAEGAVGGMEAIRATGYSWMDAFLGLIPGSMGETSALFCLFGAVVLIATKIGSWRTMAGAVLGSFVMAALFNAMYSWGWATNPFLQVPFHWHVVIGSFAFAIVFMATDPVSSAFTNKGKWMYGLLIGVFGMVIRVLNPAYPEGWMLAILFMNLFAPLLDYFVVQANVKRRAARYAA